MSKSRKSVSRATSTAFNRRQETLGFTYIRLIVPPKFLSAYNALAAMHRYEYMSSMVAEADNLSTDQIAAMSAVQRPSNLKPYERHQGMLLAKNSEIVSKKLPMAFSALLEAMDAAQARIDEAELEVAASVTSEGMLTKYYVDRAAAIYEFKRAQAMMQCFMECMSIGRYEALLILVKQDDQLHEILMEDLGNFVEAGETVSVPDVLLQEEETSDAEG